MSEHLPVHISPEVFKLKDPRVDQLRRGRISAELFALTVREGDPFVMLGDTVYALSEVEYYAGRALMPVNKSIDLLVKHVLELEDTGFMESGDQRRLERIRKGLPSCRACTYRKYRNEVYRMAKKYAVTVPDSDIQIDCMPYEADSAEYPETTEPVLPLVSLLDPSIFKISGQVRQPCLDCVEKHIAQAYILGQEARTGYPEHTVLAAGHLAEAIDEIPDALNGLRTSLEFCLARTKYTGVPFVPLFLLISDINLERAHIDTAADAEYKDTPELELTAQARAEIGLLTDPGRLGYFMKCAKRDAEAYAERPAADIRARWIGLMSCASEAIAAKAPVLSNIIRNRRLLYSVNPGCRPDICDDILNELDRIA